MPEEKEDAWTDEVEEGYQDHLDDQGRGEFPIVFAVTHSGTAVLLSAPSSRDDMMNGDFLDDSADVPEKLEPGIYLGIIKYQYTGSGEDSDLEMTVTAPQRVMDLKLEPVLGCPTCKKPISRRVESGRVLFLKDCFCH